MHCASPIPQLLQEQMNCSPNRTPKYKADLQKRLENELIDAKVLRDAGLVGDLMIDKPKKHG
jgi:hypothetical protein